MHKIPANNLRPIQSLPVPMLHKSGIILLHKGAELTEDVIRILQDADVGRIFPTQEVA